MTERQIENLISQIMRKMKGWDARAQQEDKREHPEAHDAERVWLRGRVDYLLSAGK